MKLSGVPPMLVAAAFAAAPFRAHHSFAAHFFADKLVTVHPYDCDPSYGE